MNMTTTKMPTTAVEFLTKAGNLLDERAKQYDLPGGERSMARTVEAFNAVTQRDLTEAEGWLLMQLLKDVRQWQTPGKLHQDSAEDCVSYAALKAEALARPGAPVASTVSDACRKSHFGCNWLPFRHPDRADDWQCTSCHASSATKP